MKGKQLFMNTNIHIWEWEKIGERIIKKYLEKCKGKYIEFQEKNRWLTLLLMCGGERNKVSSAFGFTQK